MPETVRSSPGRVRGEAPVRADPDLRHRRLGAVIDDRFHPRATVHVCRVNHRTSWAAERGGSVRSPVSR